jgi:hypothetical protein
MQDYASIVAALEKLVNDRATGTFFVTTEQKHSMRFGLKDGKIISVVYRATHGLAAISLVRAVRSGAPTFQADFLLPVGDNDTLPATGDLLSVLRHPLP